MMIVEPYVFRVRLDPDEYLEAAEVGEFLFRAAGWYSTADLVTALNVYLRGHLPGITPFTGLWSPCLMDVAVDPNLFLYDLELRERGWLLAVGPVTLRLELLEPETDDAADSLDWGVKDEDGFSFGLLGELSQSRRAWWRRWPLKIRRSQDA